MYRNKNAKVVLYDPDPVEFILQNLKNNVEYWIEQYGNKAKFYTDAGYNNVEFIVIPEKDDDRS